MHAPTLAPTPHLGAGSANVASGLTGRTRALPESAKHCSIPAVTPRPSHDPQRAIETGTMHLQSSETKRLFPTGPSHITPGIIITRASSASLASVTLKVGRIHLHAGQRCRGRCLRMASAESSLTGSTLVHLKQEAVRDSGCCTVMLACRNSPWCHLEDFRDPPRLLSIPAAPARIWLSNSTS